MSAEDDIIRNRRIKPETEIDFTMLTTDSTWGKEDTPQELKDALNRSYIAQDKDGNKTQIIQSLWGLLGFYTRDVRLANLDKWEELPFVRYHFDLAGDLLDCGYTNAFLTCLKGPLLLLKLARAKVDS